MITNAIAFRFSSEFNLTPSEIEEALAPCLFIECGPSQKKSGGFVPPRGEKHGPLAESVTHHIFLKFLLEVKDVPASVIRRKVSEKAEQIKTSTGRKPGRKELRELSEEIELGLLPLAFTKQASSLIWLDLAEHLLVIDATSQSKADEIVTALVKCLPGFALKALDTKISPTTAMSEWLLSQEDPSGFTVDQECELKSAGETKSTVRYSKHSLDIDEVKQHVQDGKLPTRLALTWNSRVSFVLTDNLQVKKIAYLESVFEGGSNQKGDNFDADIAIMSGELSRLFVDLVDVLGSEAPAAAH